MRPLGSSTAGMCCAFFDVQGEAEISKTLVIQYKERLTKEYRPATVNVMLSAINGYFAFVNRYDLRVKQLKIQQQAYCSKEKELTKPEYLRLVEEAKDRKNEKLSLILQAICGTGIRVSELTSITVEAVRDGEAHIRLKGKNRTILISGKLRKMLAAYVKRNGIATGLVFITKTGRPIDRSNIWKAMKALCGRAGVAAGKVFPHNLRHLFARCFYRLSKDIAKLADILGHSNINTTRIYIISTGREHRRRLDVLVLVLTS